MCNLYDIGPARSGRHHRWEGLVSNTLSEGMKAFGIRKTDPGVVIRSRDLSGVPGEIEVKAMRWGFHRAFNPAINNARIEKLTTGMWAGAWKENRRCLIPVSAFYEWSGPKGKKQTHAFVSISEEAEEESGFHRLWMAGLWENHDELGECFTMITRAATGAAAEIHDRMPAILTPSATESYLWEGGADFSRRFLEESVLRKDLSTFPCQNPLKTSSPGPPIEDPWLL